MTRKIRITTLTTGATAQPDGGRLVGGINDCQVGKSCEGTHLVADRPDWCYIVTTEVTADELAELGHAADGEHIGRVERYILDDAPALLAELYATARVRTLAARPDVYYVTTSQVADADEAAAFRPYVAVGEHLGRVAVTVTVTAGAAA